MNTLRRLRAFALSHDWGQDAYIQDGLVWVKEVLTTRDGRTFTSHQGFNDLSKLKAWAGY
jgi:hypothetical protein